VSLVVALVVAGVALLITVQVARRISLAERDPRLYRLIVTALIVHLLATCVQIWVVDHIYHGITDYNKYISQGTVLAPRFRAFNFSLAGTNIKVLGEGAVGVAAGVVFAVVGVNKLAGFLVFSYLSFVATLCFYRAFTMTFPDADRRRYALMVFFLPSLLFWTAGISKESMMYLSLGVIAYGAARVLAHRPGGGVMLVVGTLIGVYVRPQEVMLLLAAFALAGFFRRRSGRRMRGLRRLAVMALQAALLVGAVVLTQQLGKTAPVFNLNQLAKNNTIGGSAVPYTPGPAGYPHDVYVVLFDPTVNAHGNTQRVAAAENLVIIILILSSLKRLRYVFRVAFMRPYVLLCLMYSVAFPYAFAALANLGLIDRERVLLLPFLLVLLAIPVSPKGAPKTLPWELSGRVRRSRRNTNRWHPRPVGGYRFSLNPASAPATPGT
jgi:hypothetical protein